VDLLEGQVQPAALQLALGVFKGGEQSRLTSHHADQGGRLPLMDAENPQFGVQAGTGQTASGTSAVDDGIVGGADPEDKTAQKTNAAGALLGGTEGAIGLRYFFLATSERAG
jgi:hypothetical protein